MVCGRQAQLYVIGLKLCKSLRTPIMGLFYIPEFFRSSVFLFRSYRKSKTHFYIEPDILCLCSRDALIIAILNSLTSIFAGFVIFSIIGFMAFETGRDVDKVISKGNFNCA